MGNSDGNPPESTKERTREGRTKERRKTPIRRGATPDRRKSGERGIKEEIVKAIRKGRGVVKEITSPVRSKNIREKSVTPHRSPRGARQSKHPKPIGKKSITTKRTTRSSKKKAETIKSKFASMASGAVEMLLGPTETVQIKQEMMEEDTRYNMTRKEAEKETEEVTTPKEGQEETKVTRGTKPKGKAMEDARGEKETKGADRRDGEANDLKEKEKGVGRETEETDKTGRKESEDRDRKTNAEQRRGDEEAKEEVRNERDKGG